MNCITDQTTCTSCTANYNLVGNTCNCPAPYTLNGVSCDLVCDFPCDTCQAAPPVTAHCTGCIGSTGMVITGTTCECIPGQFYNSVTLVCEGCDPSCPTCVNQPTECSSCIAPKTLDLVTKTCVLVCDSNCQTCINQTTECTSCAAPLTLNATTKTCELVCDPNCKTCENQPTECKTCELPLKLTDEKICKNPCGCGKAEYGDFCELCGCLTGEDLSECICECEVEVVSHYFDLMKMDCEIEKICFELKFFSILRPDKNIREITFAEENPDLL